MQECWFEQDGCKSIHHAPMTFLKLKMSQETAETPIRSEML
ncbi:hypothetical protein [Scytonema sp. HK-05]